MVDLCVGYAAPDMETPTAQLLRSYLLPARRVAEVREGSQARVHHIPATITGARILTSGCSAWARDPLDAEPYTPYTLNPGARALPPWRVWEQGDRL